MTNYNCRPFIISIVIAVMCFLATACGTTQPSHFYMLNSMADDNKGEPASGQTGKLHIGLGPVTLPKYLDRSPIVLRGSSTEVIIDDLHRWAEPLEDNFIRVLAENLYAELDGAQISLHPWRDWKGIDYQIVITVYRFDSDTTGNITLSSNWSIVGAADEQTLYAQKSVIKESALSSDYPALVNGQSKATQQLSREIAAKLKDFVAHGK